MYDLPIGLKYFLFIAPFVLAFIFLLNIEKIIKVLRGLLVKGFNKVKIFLLVPAIFIGLILLLPVFEIIFDIRVMIVSGMSFSLFIGFIIQIIENQIKYSRERRKREKNSRNNQEQN